jgi:hypothetical protein
MAIMVGEILFNQAWTSWRIIRIDWLILLHMFWLCSNYYANILIAIDPANKLSFYHEQTPDKYDEAKTVFLKAVSYFLIAFI